MLTERVDPVILEPKRTVDRIIKQVNKLANESILIWRGDWDTLIHYEPGDVVTDGTTKWLALTKNDGVTPVEGTDWTEIAGSSSSGGGGNVLPLDFEPATAHAKDDDFTALTLDPKWTNPVTTGVGLGVAIGFDSSWLSIEPSTAGSASTGLHGIFGIRQPAPIGSFSISAKIVDDGTGDDTRTGIFVADTVSGKGHILGIQRQNSRAANANGFTYSETADSSGYDGYDTYVGPMVTLCWLKIKWDAASSTFIFYYSLDGGAWVQLNTRSGMTQPTRIGLGLWANSSDVKANHILRADWFRVTEP